MKKRESAPKHTKKAVRIKEPDVKRTISTIHVDPATDSGYQSARCSRPSDFDISESYLWTKQSDLKQKNDCSSLKTKGDSSA